MTSPLFIIAPMASGKSTFVGSHPLGAAVESDAAQPPLEHPLHALRLAALQRDDWKAYNHAWLENHLRPWFRSLQTIPGIVLVHSEHDALALDPTCEEEGRVLYVLPPLRIIIRRAVARGDDGAKLTLVHQNWRDLQGLTARRDLKTFPSIEAAIASRSADGPAGDNSQSPDPKGANGPNPSP